MSVDDLASTRAMASGETTTFPQRPPGRAPSLQYIPCSMRSRRHPARHRAGGVLDPDRAIVRDATREGVHPNSRHFASPGECPRAVREPIRRRAAARSQPVPHGSGWNTSARLEFRKVPVPGAGWRPPVIIEGVDLTLHPRQDLRLPVSRGSVGEQWDEQVLAGLWRKLAICRARSVMLRVCDGYPLQRVGASRSDAVARALPDREPQWSSSASSPVALHPTSLGQDHDAGVMRS